MAHNEVVSVTIVTYNSGRFIKRCLESVLAQKYSPKEVIVVDNASTDGTIDILEQFDDRRRAMIDDISLDGEFCDCDFFVYREDADVAWRAQLMGWKCLYAPYARGYHVRKVLPGNRRALPPEINMHSVKNRFLMRIKNISPNLYGRNWFSITTRYITVVMCCLLWEHTSLRAFWYLARNWRRVVEKRRMIQASRRVDHNYMASWFQYTPV